MGRYDQLSQSDNNDYLVTATTTSMGTSLVAPDPEDVAKPATAIPMIEITAPATLVEGYKLDTMVGNDQVVTITIPPGGVEKGQTFSVPMMPQMMNSANQHNLSIVPKLNVPVGHWKDSIWSCCTYGCCHASVCTSCWCHALAAGQVITRLQLNWLGKPTNSLAEKASAFTTLLFISVFYFASKVLLFFIIMSMTPDVPNDNPPPSSALTTVLLLNDLVNYSYYFFSVVVIYNLRYVHESRYKNVIHQKSLSRNLTSAVVALAPKQKTTLSTHSHSHYVRSKYAIPGHEGCPAGGCEDGCCALCCPCLTVAQIMRHTTDYDTYRAEWFSATGLPDHVPALIV